MQLNLVVRIVTTRPVVLCRLVHKAHKK